MLKDIEKYCLEKLITINELENGIQYKKELRIIEECIAESTLDIWSKKNIFFPELTQYELYKCFIFKFELSFGGFINPNIDLFHYTLKSIVFCDKIGEVTRDNLKQYFENGTLIDKHTSSGFIQLAEYENGDWYIKYK